MTQALARIAQAGVYKNGAVVLFAPTYEGADENQIGILLAENNFVPESKKVSGNSKRSGKYNKKKRERCLECLRRLPSLSFSNGAEHPERIAFIDGSQKYLQQLRKYLHSTIGDSVRDAMMFRRCFQMISKLALKHLSLDLLEEVAMLDIHEIAILLLGNQKGMPHRAKSLPDIWWSEHVALYMKEAAKMIPNIAVLPESKTTVLHPIGVTRFDGPRHVFLNMLCRAMTIGGHRLTFSNTETWMTCDYCMARRWRFVVSAKE